MRRLALSCFLLFSFAPSTYAAHYWDEECFTSVVTKNAMLRKYDYKYMWGSSDTITKGQEGSSKVTSQNTTQGTTAGVDPGYITGHTKRDFMSTSSKKPCAFITEARAEREQFVANNGDELKRDIARGDGASLRAFAVLSGCQDAAFAAYFAAARAGYASLADARGLALSGAIDDATTGICH